MKCKLIYSDENKCRCYLKKTDKLGVFMLLLDMVLVMIKGKSNVKTDFFAQILIIK